MPRLRPLLLTAALAIVTALAAPAQSSAGPSAALPRFDAASIKPRDPGSPYCPTLKPQNPHPEPSKSAPPPAAFPL